MIRWTKFNNLDYKYTYAYYVKCNGEVYLQTKTQNHTCQIITGPKQKHIYVYTYNWTRVNKYMYTKLQINIFTKYNNNKKKTKFSGYYLVLSKE